LSDLRGFLIPLPSPPEQRAIAGALSDVDALLGALDQLIAKKRDLKQAAMQQLLTGQTRLPDYAPTKPEFKQTEVGIIPDDWRLARLATLVDPARSIRYGIVQPGDYDQQGRYMIRGQDYSEVKGWAAPSEVFRVSQRIEERYRNARVKTGDLIMTIVGYCGHVEVIPEWLDGANLTQTPARIAIQPDKAVSAFCMYVLRSPTGRNQVAAYMKGAAQPGLNCGDVEKFVVVLPPLPEQTAIAEVLSDMDAELAGLEQRRAKTRALKQGMMQELLTGRTRLV
jgi:type I restriction enzyme S subunit